jgi:hypothetical protein
MEPLLVRKKPWRIPFTGCPTFCPVATRRQNESRRPRSLSPEQAPRLDPQDFSTQGRGRPIDDFGLYLPNHANITPEDIAYVAKNFREVAQPC